MECDTETGTFKKHSDNLADLTNCHFRLKEGNFQQKQNIFHYTVFNSWFEGNEGTREAPATRIL